MEIERKYQVLNLPEHLSEFPFKKIEQGYLCHNPTIRIRKSNDEYILTYKSKLGLEHNSSAIVNQEVELPLTKESYETLKTKTEGNFIKKIRYLIPLKDGLTAELDIFEGVLRGLIYVEVEFPDLKASDEFIPPEWFGKDLSGDKRYSNYQLSKLSGIEELVINING